MTVTCLMKIYIHQLVGMTCDRSKFHWLSMTGNWARSFSLFLTTVTPSQRIQNLNNKEFMMFDNDGDLPSCDVIVANFLGPELDSVKMNDDGDLSSMAAKSFDNNELEANGAAGANSRY